jgi:sugar O-acyltransferase (sialic acid O-acetyltransferase NeuD family)
MDKRILLIGGGGHCKSVLDSLLIINEYSEIGIIDKKENIGKKIMGIQVLGCDKDLSKLYNSGFGYAFITIGSIGNPILRIKLYNIAKKIGFKFPKIADPSAVISEYAEIKTGTYVGKQAVVNTGAVINECAIINTGAIIEHNCHIKEFVHIAPGAVLSGEVSVGQCTHIGANATVKQQVQIGSNSIIGMGSLVSRNIGDKILAYGVPCKEIRKL